MPGTSSLDGDGRKDGCLCSLLLPTAEQAAPHGASSQCNRYLCGSALQCPLPRDQKGASAGKGQGQVSNFSHRSYKPILAACGVHLFPFNQPETVLPEHGADPEAHLPPASPSAAVLALSYSLFQKSNDFAGDRDISLPTACQASCSPWDRASEGI